VAVGVDDILNDKPVLMRFGDNPLHIRTGVDYHGFAGPLASDKIAEIVHVSDVELSDDHSSTPLLKKPAVYCGSPLLRSAVLYIYYIYF
jgi:hypothetical protein